MTGNRALMQQIRKTQPTWFSPSNKRLFHDKQYAAFYGKQTGDRYMVRSTYAWTDMFGSAPRLHYRINPIDDNYNIRPLVDRVFDDYHDVIDWLKEN